MLVDIVPRILYNPAMEYLTTKAIAEKWNISDRRVRVLCRDGRIPDVIEDGKTYLIPFDAEKPADKRYRASSGKLELQKIVNSFGEETGLCLAEAIDGIAEYGKTILYLKWEDDIVAKIDSNYNLFFTEPKYNRLVSTYSGGHRYWSREQLEAFLHDRIVSRERRDIERIMFRCGLSAYDTIKLGIATRAMSARDLLWITPNCDERMQNAMTEVFDSVFNRKIDAAGDSVDTPDGCNVKRYGAFNGKYGIFKKRLSPITTDLESELAVYEIAQLMGVPCCPVYKTDEDTLFSQFEYDFSKEYVVHIRRLFENGIPRGENEYFNLVAVRPQYQADFIRMILLDFVTRQDDRHLSNIAVKITNSGESFYPLYDNGRSLFYEDSEELAKRACQDIELYASGFGPRGTYLDCIRDIAESGVQFSKLVNLNIKKSDTIRILERAGFKDYRLDCAAEWIMGALDILRDMD